MYLQMVRKQFVWVIQLLVVICYCWFTKCICERIRVHRLGDGTGVWVMGINVHLHQVMYLQTEEVLPLLLQDSPITAVTSNSLANDGAGCDNYNWNDGVCLD